MYGGEKKRKGSSSKQVIQQCIVILPHNCSFALTSSFDVRDCYMIQRKVEVVQWQKKKRDNVQKRKKKHFVLGGTGEYVPSGRVSDVRHHLTKIIYSMSGGVFRKLDREESRIQ